MIQRGAIARRLNSNRLWTGGAVCVAALVGLPVVVVLGALFLPASENWTHLTETVLADYVVNTVGLMVLTGVLAGFLGVATAWVCSMGDFPGRKAFSWLLVLPLAAPGYVIAYVYTDLLEYAGPVQSLLRSMTGWQAQDYYFPAIRSLPGAALVLGLVLYPYVYLLCRATFVTQAGAYMDAARVHNAGPWRAFFRVALPTARPALAGGLALVLMETVADYGVVEYFGVSTFTTGIFRAWYGLGDRTAALKLAADLFVIVALLVLLERLGRRGRVSNPVSRSHPGQRNRYRGARAWLAVGLCSIPVVLGLLLPLGILVFYAVTVGDPLWGRSFSALVTNTFTVAGIAALATTALALWLVYGERLSNGRVTLVAGRIGTLGYALPGAVVAIGVLVPLARLDILLADAIRDHTSWRPALYLTGSVFALLIAYCVRFITVAYNSCQSGMEKIHLRMDDVGRSLGAGPGRLLKEIHLPLMAPSVASAVLLVFIDVVKELPATLILRPFNFETLATRVFRLASDEQLPQASTAALCIVLLGLVPAILLSLRIRRRQ